MSSENVLDHLRGCLHMKFHPGMKLVPWRNHPSLWWNFSYCLHIFAEMKLYPGMNSSLSKRQEWNYIPGWKKGEKKHVNASSQDEILNWANFKIFFFFNCWRIYSIMLSKVNIFEHNESMNIMKHKAYLWKVKSEKKKVRAKQVKNQ